MPIPDQAAVKTKYFEAVGMGAVSFAPDKVLRDGGPNRRGHLFKEEQFALRCLEPGSSARDFHPRLDTMVIPSGCAQPVHCRQES